MLRTPPSTSARAPRLATLLLVLVAASTHAQVGREQAAHVHGTTAITLAVVDGTFELELVAPGMDLVGFEHAPRDAQQTQAVAAATATLERSGDWLAFEPGGSCIVTQANARSHGFGHDATVAGAPPDRTAAHDGHADVGDGTDHDGGHDHDDHGHGDAGGHGEFQLQLTGTCSASPQALRIDLGARFPGIGQIRVDLVTDSAQDRVELGAGQTRVPLAR